MFGLHFVYQQEFAEKCYYFAILRPFPSSPAVVHALNITKFGRKIAYIIGFQTIYIFLYLCMLDFLCEQELLENANVADISDNDCVGIHGGIDLKFSVIVNDGLERHSEQFRIYLEKNRPFRSFDDD